MALGNIFFAWVDPEETTFGPEHERYDENVFSFQLEQSEGDFATLELEVRRPRNEAGEPMGLLAPSRKIWAWFAFDCGSGLVKLFGRLVGVTSNILTEVVSIRFIARPVDYAAQKAALAEALRVLPNYDPIFIDEARRDDPDAVLEGYSAIWHIDRETHAVTVSDILVGEDAPIELAPYEMDFQGLDMAPAGVPLTSVMVSAELTWTQLASGAVDLTEYITTNWPNEEIVAAGVISSFTFGADNWPQNGASLGDGWVAAEASATDKYGTPHVASKTEGSTNIIKWWDGATTTLQASTTTDEAIGLAPGSILLLPIPTSNQSDSKLGDWEPGLGETSGTRPIVSWSRKTASTQHVVPLNQVEPKLSAAYDSNRKCTENVTFVLTADMQPILTEPGEDEALRVDLRSVNLSEMLGEGTGAEIPIGDTARRSYITTDRGQQSLQYMIAVARAHLRKKARAVEITVAPHIGRFPEITLRKSVMVNDPRIPDGQAFGKIIGYSLGLDGDNGNLAATLKLGCPIGRGGTVATVDGDPVYVQEGYVEVGYQTYEGSTLLFDDTVGFTPPVFAPQDDGIDFLSGLTPEEVIEQPLEVTFPAAAQRSAIVALSGGWGGAGDFVTDEEAQAHVSARAEAVSAVLKEMPTTARFKLKSMQAEFTSPYEIAVTEMKIPTGFNLEAE